MGGDNGLPGVPRGLPGGGRDKPAAPARPQGNYQGTGLPQMPGQDRPDFRSIPQGGQRDLARQGWQAQRQQQAPAAPPPAAPPPAAPPPAAAPMAPPQQAGYQGFRPGQNPYQSEILGMANQIGGQQGQFDARAAMRKNHELKQFEAAGGDPSQFKTWEDSGMGGQDWNSFKSAQDRNAARTSYYQNQMGGLPPQQAQGQTMEGGGPGAGYNPLADQSLTTPQAIQSQGPAQVGQIQNLPPNMRQIKPTGPVGPPPGMGGVKPPQPGGGGPPRAGGK